VGALQAYRARGGLVILLTNAPRPADRVEHFLAWIGAPRDSYDAVMSSGSACQRAAAHGAYGRRFHYIGLLNDVRMLTELGLADTLFDQAEAILCAGLRDDTREDLTPYRAEVETWRAHRLPLLCANPDLVVDWGERRLYCAGALAQLYQEAGGEVVWFGKPHLATYEECFGLLAELAGRAIAPARVLAIGDGIRTDVRGGLDYGFAVVFVTGGLAGDELGADPEHPDPDRLGAFLAAHGVAPKYAIGRLR